MRLITFLTICALPLAAADHRVQSLNIRILSTMLADSEGIGEWGFAALVEVDGHRILFDTGARPDTVLINTKELGVDLSSVTDVVLSHNHGDHTVGLVPLRNAMKPKSAGSLSKVYVGKGIFLSRPGPRGDNNWILRHKAEFEATGGQFIEIAAPTELLPGVWLTGPVPRKYPERNFPAGSSIQTAAGEKIDDTIPEDLSMVFNTDKGLVVLSGCGHAGIANTLDYARASVRNAPIHAAVGGWHLFALDDEKLKWTAGKLREYGVENFLGAHCTGIEAVYRIRQLNGMSRQTCVVGAVGASFELGKGIHPGAIAH